MKDAIVVSHHSVVDRLIRLGLAAPFLASGLMKATDFAGAIAEVRALTGIDTAAGTAAIVALQLVAGTLLVTRGGLARASAWALIAFTLVATVVAHAFWAHEGARMQRELMTFLEHVAIIAGLAWVATARPRDA